MRSRPVIQHWKNIPSHDTSDCIQLCTKHPPTCLSAFQLLIMHRWITELIQTQKKKEGKKKAWLKGIYFTKKAPCKRDTCLKKAVVKFPPSIAISPSILFWFAFFKMFSSTVRSLINLRRNIKRFSLLKITFLFFTGPMIIGCIKPPPTPRWVGADQVVWSV